MEKNKNSRLRKVANIEKTSGFISQSEDDVLEMFPGAEKINNYSYVARKGDYTVWIKHDSIMDAWRVAGRTKDDPSVWQKFMDGLMSLFS